jgi:ACS family hexuronate transporter-like MFS transporter
MESTLVQRASGGGGRRAWLALAGVIGVTGVASCATLVYAPLAPFLVDDLDIGYAAVGGLTSALFLGAAFASPRAGRAVDALGAGPALTISVVAMAACMALAALVPAGYAGLLVTALLAGGAFALVNPASNAAVGLAFARATRGTAMGLKQTGIAAGGVLAGLWLPGAAIAFGWRAALLQVALGLLVAAAVSARFLGGRPSAAPPARAARPARPADRSLALWTGGLLLSGAQGFLMAYLVLYALDEGTFAAAAAGGVFAAMQLSALLGRVALGAVSDRVFGGRRRPVLVGAALAAAFALAGIGAASRMDSSAVLVLCAVAGGLTAIGWNGVYMAALIDVAPAELHGTASGVGVGFNLAGVVAFPLLGGLLLDAGLGFPAAWLLAAALALAAAACFYAFREPAPSVSEYNIQSA